MRNANKFDCHILFNSTYLFYFNINMFIILYSKHNQREIIKHVFKQKRQNETFSKYDF